MSLWAYGAMAAGLHLPPKYPYTWKQLQQEEAGLTCQSCGLAVGIHPGQECSLLSLLLSRPRFEQQSSEIAEEPVQPLLVLQALAPLAWVRCVAQEWTCHHHS